MCLVICGWLSLTSAMDSEQRNWPGFLHERHWAHLSGHCERWVPPSWRSVPLWHLLGVWYWCNGHRCQRVGGPHKVWVEKKIIEGGRDGRKRERERERERERGREICIMSPLFLYICSGISNGLVGERSTCQQFWHARTWRHCSAWHLHSTSLPIRQRVRPSHPYHYIIIIM